MQTYETSTPVLTMGQLITACKRGEIPEAIADLAELGPEERAIVNVLRTLGALEPVGAMRPPATVISTYVEEEIPVDPASDAEVGTEAKFWNFCAAIGSSVMIRRLRITAANQTAADDGEVSYRGNKLISFRDMCVVTNPSSWPGKLISLENLALCPNAGFEVHAINRNQNSIARFHLEAELWQLP